jgi:hypothetical protein
MTRKDYVAVASVIADVKACHAVGPEAAGVTLALFAVAEDLAKVMKRDNAAFDYGRFMTACTL